MLETTGDLKLKKIELTDTPDITVINPNWDKLDEEVTRNKTNIGNTEQLTTQNNTSLVDAVNEIDENKIAKTQIKNTLEETIEGSVLDARQGKTLKERIGSLSSLLTTVKTSAIAAINEVVTNIGSLSSLVTNIKTSIVDAINENANKIEVLSADRGYKDTKLLSMGMDLNTLTQNGKYKGEALLNAPYSGWCYIDVISHTDGWVKQTLTPLVGTTIEHVRRKEDGIWKDWKPIATTTKTDILQCLTGGWTVVSDCVFSAQKIGNRIFIEGIIHNSSPGQKTIAVGLPIPSDRKWHGGVGVGNNNGVAYMVVDPTGTLSFQSGGYTQGILYSISIDYPV